MVRVAPGVRRLHRRYVVNDFQQRVGVGQPHYGLGRTGPTRQRKVIAEEGDRKGRTAAVLTDHADGRVDAQVFPATIRRKISLTGD